MADKPWTLDAALDLIRGLQPKTPDCGYHLCLGGGVLNNGRSDKDLDLYFLPLGSGKPSDAEKLKAYLERLWGAGTDLFVVDPDAYEGEGVGRDGQLRLTIDAWRQRGNDGGTLVPAGTLPDGTPLYRQRRIPALPAELRTVTEWRALGVRRDELVFSHINTANTAIYWREPPLEAPPADNDPPGVYKHKLKFTFSEDWRIDVFIL